MPSNEQRRTAAKRKLERQLANRAERARRRRIVGVVATVVGVVAVVGLIYWLANLGGDDTQTPAASDTSTPELPPDTPAAIPTELAPQPKRATPLPATVTCDYPATPNEPAAKAAQAPPTANIAAQGTVAATLATSAGEVKVTLDRSLAPCAVNSFVSLAKQNYFTDTSCHRMTTSESLQVLQCGDPSGTGQGGPGYSFDDEVYPELTYGRGILAMANAGKDQTTGKGTNGSQFFIVYGNAQLPPNYSAFGTVDAESLKKIDEVAKAGVVSEGNPGDGKPKTPVTITGVTVAN